MNDHPNKEIRAAVDDALAAGWRLVKAGGHAHIWGKLRCPLRNRTGCQISVYCTPKSPQNHAKRIRREINRCPH